MTATMAQTAKRCRRGTAWAASVLALVLAAAPPAWSAPDALASCTVLRASGNPQYPPYLWVDPEDDTRLLGAIDELSRWLGAEIGVPVQLRHVGPWARVQAEARAGNLDLIAGAFFTLPRTEYMDYVHPAFQQTRSVVWVGPGTRLTYRRWDDLVGLRGVTVIHNSFGEAFDRFAREKLSLTGVSDLEQAIQMVQRARADYLVYEDKPGQAYVARLGAQGMRELEPPVATEALHLTLSHKSPCNTPELRARLARAMFKLERDKLMPGFVERAIERWKAR